MARCDRGAAQQGLRVHASFAGYPQCIWGCYSNCGSLKQGLCVHASSHGTLSAAGAARRDRVGVNQTQPVAAITWWKIISLADFAKDGRGA